MKRIIGFVLGLFLCGAIPCRGAFCGSHPDPQDAKPPAVELRVGALLHNRKLSLKPRAEEGMDVNLEALLPSPDSAVFRMARAPRPHIGVTVNTDGGTSALYGGLTWRLLSRGAVSFEGSFGAALHNGKLDAHNKGREDLGSRGLFRMSAELSAMLLPRHGFSLFIDHMSNAGLAAENDGITNAGIRYLRRF
jgi:lipid A 3-O-deacylase